jgi:hypothetical protein
MRDGNGTASIYPTAVLVPVFHLAANPTATSCFFITFKNQTRNPPDWIIPQTWRLYC